MKKILYFTIISILSATNSYAAIPSISTAADQKVAVGTAYDFSPSLFSGDEIIWSKEYGPDDMVVDAATGRVQWNIPADFPGESFHFGVRASNSEGSDIETWILTVGDGNVLYCGTGTEYLTLAEGMASMDSGDTLVMKDGVYRLSGYENTIPGYSIKSQAPPGGSSAGFTTVMAENPGGVTLDAQGTNKKVFYLVGDYDPPDFGFEGTVFNRNYIAIKGFIAKNTTEYSAIVLEFCNYVKIIDCGVVDSGREEGLDLPNIYVRRCDHVLIEGLYSWGHSRYKMQFKDTTNSICRRSVARIDEYRGHQPIGGFTSYCSKNIEFQNNIVIDGDRSEFWVDYENIINPFGVAAQGCSAYPQGNVFSKCILLNTRLGLMQTDATENPNPTTWKNCIGWDLDLDRYEHGAGMVTPILLGAGVSETNQCTIGNIRSVPNIDSLGRAFFYSRSGPSLVKNSILYQLGWDGDSPADQGPLAWSQSESGGITLDYNNIYQFQGSLTGGGGSETISNTFTTNPSLKYLVRTSDGDANLQNSGENGARVGANITTFVGNSGTFYGDPGYDTETGISSWPFPHEDLIREKMRAYSYTGITRNGSTQMLSGNRGFCADGQTLTKYIWEYLGNTIPPEIYSYSPISGHEPPTPPRGLNIITLQ